MDRAPLPNLNSLDRDALVALIRAHQEKLAAREGEVHRLEAELESHLEPRLQDRSPLQCFSGLLRLRSAKYAEVPAASCALDPEPI